VRLLGRVSRPEAPETAQESPSCDRFDARRLESHHQSKLFRPSLIGVVRSAVWSRPASRFCEDVLLLI
jgi:hypothetical protein